MTKQENQQFNNWLSETRTSKNVSKRGLSEKTGISRSALIKLEDGSRSPMLETAIVISQALGEETPIPAEVHFGDWLSERRSMSGLGVRELARLSGVNHGTISRLEKNHREPTLKTARKLINVFKNDH